MRTAIRLAAAILALGFAVAAQAEEFVSTNTSIAQKACKKASQYRVGNVHLASARVCRGVSGYVVLVREDDLRETLSAGKTVRAASKEPAATQSFESFNGFEDKIEWRSVKGTRAPFALIAQWYLDENEHEDANGRPTAQNMLVVFRLAPGPVCKVAVVDMKANADATELARKAADESARPFKCATDKLMVVGARGRTTEMLFPAP